MQRKRPTIADVAQAAGVSIGTVSNFINGTAAVREETGERIQNAIRELTYRPSTFARSLSGLSGRKKRNLEGLPRLLVVGHICVDYLCRVNVLPHRDDRVTARHIEKALGGPAANLAVAAAGVGEPYALQVDLVTADADCAEVPADNPFVSVFQKAVEEASLSSVLSDFGAHSDIGLPTGLGNTPTVNFGPGDPTQAHQPNERVSVRDLVDCTKAIALAIEKWCR